MAKAATHSTPGETPDSTGSHVVRSFVSRLRSWYTIGWRLAVGFGVWILGAWALHGYTSVPEFAQMAAVAYWFGWLFAGVTALFLLGMLLTGVVYDLRNPVR